MVTLRAYVHKSTHEYLGEPVCYAIFSADMTSYGDWTLVETLEIPYTPHVLSESVKQDIVKLEGELCRLNQEHGVKVQQLWGQIRDLTRAKQKGDHE